MFAAMSTPQLPSHQHIGSVFLQRFTEVEIVGRRSVLNGGWGKAFPVICWEGVGGLL